MSMGVNSAPRQGVHVGTTTTKTRASWRTWILPGPPPFVLFQFGGGTRSSDGGGESVVRIWVALFADVASPQSRRASKGALPAAGRHSLPTTCAPPLCEPAGDPSWNLNSGADAPGGVGDGIVLTTKEIKDVVLWLVCESIDVVEKICRKGDEWCRHE